MLLAWLPIMSLVLPNNVNVARPQLAPVHHGRTAAPLLVANSEADGGSVVDRVTSSPARLAMLATYVSALYYVGSGTAPAGDPDATISIIKDCLDMDAAPSIFFSIFNALGVVPAIYAAVLLPGAQEQKPVPPALIATSFFAGYGGLAPYLILREPRPEPVFRNDLGFLARTLTESKLFAAGLLLTSLALAAKLVAIPDFDAALATYWSLFDEFGIVNVSSFDLLVLSAFFFEPAKEDMRRRGWWAAPGEEPTTEQVARLAAFCAVPVIGPASYLVARPALPESE